MSPRKVEPQKPSTSATPEDSTFARVTGVFFVLIAIVIVGLLILSFVVSRLPYKTDASLPIPTLNNEAEYTNKTSMDVSGSDIPGETVTLFVNGKMENEQTRTDENGNFTFKDISLSNEGKYTFQATTIRGKFFKKESEKSNEIAVTVDRTAPSKNVTVNYQPTNTTGAASISGTADPNTTVILHKGGKEFETQTDNEGAFEFKDVTLQSGQNDFTISVRDEAGNEVASSTTVAINFEAGSINGDGASTSQLPESAGELDKINEFLKGNGLMLIMGMLALIAFAASSTVVYLKKR